MIKTFFKNLRSIIIYLVSLMLDLFTFEIHKKGNFKIFILRILGINLTGPCFIDIGFRFIYPQNITIGPNCSFGHHNKIWAFDKVIIGDYVQTALGLTIISGGHVTDSYENLENQQVVIEGENWIGANVTILGGVTIGKGSIIGAGSLVNKDIPPYCVAVGVPAKVIKKRVPSDKVISTFGWYTPQIYKK